MLIPHTLRGRFIATTVVVALAVAASTIAIGAALEARTARVRAAGEAVETLGHFREYVRLTTGRIGARADYLAARPDVAAHLRSGDTTSMQYLLSASFPPDDGRSVLVMANDGRVIAQVGPDPQRYASASEFPDGPRLVSEKGSSSASIVVTRSIPASGTPIGSITVASPLGTATRKGFQGLVGTPLLLAPVGTAAKVQGWPSVEVAGFSDSHYSSDGKRTRVLATYLGTDGKPVTDVGVDRIDDALGQAAYATWISLLAATLFALIIGLALGVAVADRIRAPIEAMVGRVKHEGNAAIEGLPYSGVSLDDDRLTNEFRELGAVVDDLLYGLSARQAELQRVTAATQEAEEALAVTVNESPDAKVLVQDGLIRIANPATTSHFGIGPRAMLGRTPREAFNKLGMVDAAGMPLDWDHLVSAAREEPARIRLTIAGRGERWLEVYVAEPPGSTKTRLLLSARDITAARHLEQLRDDLVSMVGHDLRSPLTVIVGYLDLLSTDLPAAVRLEAVGSARANAERLDAMLDDLLEAARAEQVFVPREFLPVDLCAVAEEIAVSLRGSYPDHPVEVACEDERAVLGEERRLRQALMNLASNAAKYSPGNTHVVIRIEGDEEYVRLVVEDEGPGIPDESKQAIFDRFTRIGTSSGRPGMGLGLYIVRTVAEGHEGRAYVEDRASGGSRFVMELPAAPEDPSPEQPPVEAADDAVAGEPEAPGQA